MSSKRAKRHQLIVCVSNGNRAQNKRSGFKHHESYLWLFYIPEARIDLKPRYRNVGKEVQRKVHREEPYTGNYKQDKAKIIRLLISELGPRKLKGMGTIK